MTLKRSNEKHNNKFNIADYSRICDGFKKRRQNEVTVEPGAVRPAGIAMICRKRMLEIVLNICRRRYRNLVQVSGNMVLMSFFQS